jgi:hypothetical protein
MSGSALHRGVVSVLVSQLFIPPPNSAYASDSPSLKHPNVFACVFVLNFLFEYPSPTSVRVMKLQECCFRGHDVYFGRDDSVI